MANTLAEYESLISSEIGQQETGGGTAGVGLTLNNPGALKYAPWETQYGATQTASGFASFPNLTGGYAALLDRVQQLVEGGQASITSLINTWAPPSDGNTNNAQRISQIASATGLDPNAPIAGQASSSAGAIAGTVASTAANSLTSIATGGLTSFSWQRALSVIVGLVCLIAGLFMLHNTSPVEVVENVDAGARRYSRAGSRVKGAIPKRRAARGATEAAEGATARAGASEAAEGTLALAAAA